MRRRVVNRFAELLAIKERRERRTWTRRELEIDIGVSLTSIQNWIHNRNTQYSIVQIEAIAKFLGVQPGDLFMWEDVQEGGGESPEIKTPLAVAW